MTDIGILVDDLRMHLGAEISSDIAGRALAHALAEAPRGAGARWLVKRAAYVIRQRRDGYRTEWSA